jgi:hypothetical protein
VLISMATSSGDDLPRQIEFLYSCNRLNVAISRARCLAVIVASPRLLETSCSTIEQLRLVNSFCWAKNFADRQSDHTPIAITLIPSGASTRAEAGRTTRPPSVVAIFRPRTGVLRLACQGIDRWSGHLRVSGLPEEPDRRTPDLG